MFLLSLYILKISLSYLIIVVILKNDFWLYLLNMKCLSVFKRISTRNLAMGHHRVHPFTKRAANCHGWNNRIRRVCLSAKSNVDVPITCHCRTDIYIYRRLSFSIYVSLCHRNPPAYNLHITVLLYYMSLYGWRARTRKWKWRRTNIYLYTNTYIFRILQGNGTYPVIKIIVLFNWNHLWDNCSNNVILPFVLDSIRVCVRNVSYFVEYTSSVRQTHVCIFIIIWDIGEWYELYYSILKLKNGVECTTNEVCGLIWSVGCKWSASVVCVCVCTCVCRHNAALGDPRRTLVIRSSICSSASVTNVLFVLATCDQCCHNMQAHLGIS